MTSREDVTALAGRAIVTVRRRRAAGAAAAVLLLLVTAACNDDDDANPDVDEQPVLEVDTSTAEPVCMQVDEAFPPEVERLPIIDCTKPHSHEIYATVKSEADVFPGVEALGDTAQVECLEAFEPFVGASPFDSVLSYTWLVPTLGSWNDEDDREILCVLMHRDGSPMVGTMRGAQV